MSIKAFEVFPGFGNRGRGRLGPAPLWIGTESAIQWLRMAELREFPEPVPRRSRVRPDTGAVRIVELKNLADVESIVADWDDLARNALVPNVFYEHWALMPALELLRGEADVRLVAVINDDPKTQKQAPLLGLFPLLRSRMRLGLPVSNFRMWQHRYCFLCTPVVRRDCPDTVVNAFLEWLSSPESGGALMEFEQVSAEGPFHRALVEALTSRREVSGIANSYTRAFFRRATDAEAYLRASFSSARRKNLRRLANRLGEAGRVTFEELAADAEPASWIAEFLRLEASGWKGRNGTAMAQEAHSREFFTRVATEAHRRGRLMMLGIFLDGRPIAMKCNLLAAPGGFAFKIAYDEEFSRYSPGLQLEVFNVERLHARGDVRWMDSCAAPDHPMISHVWPDRTTIGTVLVSAGEPTGDLSVVIQPFRRWVGRRLVPACRNVFNQWRKDEAA